MRKPINTELSGQTQKDSDSVIVKVRILLALLDTSVDNGFYWGFYYALGLYVAYRLFTLV